MTKNLSKSSGQPKAPAQRIANYYDANTRKFLRFGGAGDTGAIHRAIWSPGVTSRQEAFLFLNQLVRNAIKPIVGEAPEETHLLDLGCGVGGTSTYIAQELGIRVTGISISATQTEIATARTQAATLSQRVNYITADFDTLSEFGEVDAICAIESFVHSRDASAFFAQAAASLKSHGRLIICDDFLGQTISPRGLRYVRRFKTGWQLNTLITVNEVESLAAVAGLRLVESHPLSQYLRGFPSVGRWAVDWLCRIPLPWAYWHNLSGGTALQLCVKRGWTEYQALVWEKI